MNIRMAEKTRIIRQGRGTAARRPQAQAVALNHGTWNNTRLLPTAQETAMAFTGPKKARAVAAVVFALTALPAAAAEPVAVSGAWVRATVPGQNVAGAYMELTSQQSAALVAADTPAAGKTELHTMAMDAGVMKMRPVERIELPARQTVSLKPGGLHVMLVGIKHPLKPGDRVPLTLTVQDAQGVRSTLRVEAAVRDATGAVPAAPGHSSHE
jgi:periplasmic copper chaperone A